jgi:hypothetical protein
MLTLLLTLSFSTRYAVLVCDTRCKASVTDGNYQDGKSAEELRQCMTFVSGDWLEDRKAAPEPEPQTGPE